MGCWECMGVKNAHVKRKSSKAQKVSEKKCHRKDVFKLTRHYYSNESLPSLKKIIKKLGANTSIRIKICICFCQDWVTILT